MAWTCATAVLVRRQGTARACIEGGPSRHTPAFDYRRDVASDNDKTQTSRARFMACPDAGEETEDACRRRTGEQDGTENLGHADETGRLPGASVGSGGMIGAGLNTLILVKEV